MSDVNLLNDEQVIDFIIRGYHVTQTLLPEIFHSEIDRKLTALTENPGNEIIEVLPELREVYEDANVKGALVSLLGEDFNKSHHQHWHSRPPGPGSQGWHQDGANQRHHQTRTVLALYYPHDVTIDMGPTVVMPGTHFRNCPTDQMATYANIRGQVPILVKAGGVAITHYDIWHGGTVNRSDRPRHMIKFLFNRVSEPKQPSWNHDPVQAAALAARKFSFDRPHPQGQSDQYKSIGLRRQMWLHMLGDTVLPVAHSSHSDKNYKGANRY